MRIKEFIEMIKRNRPKPVCFTPDYVEYMFAGDYAEPYCPTCECMPLEDGTNFCPHCGQRLEWDFYPPRWYFIKLRVKKLLRIKDKEIKWPD